MRFAMHPGDTTVCPPFVTDCWLIDTPLSHGQMVEVTNWNFDRTVNDIMACAPLSVTFAQSAIKNEGFGHWHKNRATKVSMAACSVHVFNKGHNLFRVVKMFATMSAKDDFHMLKFQIAQSCVLGLDKMFMVFLLSELNHSWHANKKAKSHWRCSDWGDCFPCWFDFFVQFQCLKHDCSSLHCFMLGHWEWQVKISHALWWTASRWTKKQWPAWNSFCSLCLLSIQHIRHQNTKHRCWHPKHGVDKWNNMKMPLDVCFDSLKCSKGNQKVQTVNCHWLF